MQFISSFSALGYSAIVLIVAFVFIAAMLFASLGMARRSLWAKLVFMALVVALFVPTTIFLADQRAMLMDSIHAEGGLQRIETLDQTTPATD
jgi:hypothetical protein